MMHFRSRSVRRNRWSRFFQNNSGVAAVEFAFIAVPLFFLTGMMMELGIVFFHMNSLHNAVELVGRTIRLNDLGPGRAGDVRQIACDSLILISDCDSTFHLDVRTIDEPPADPVGDSGIDPSALIMRTSFAEGDVVVVSGYIQWNFITQLPNLMLDPISAGNDFILSSSTLHMVETPR